MGAAKLRLHPRALTVSTRSQAAHLSNHGSTVELIDEEIVWLRASSETVMLHVLCVQETKNWS